MVELAYREDNVLHLNGVDILDGTPLLDIEPHTARFDVFKTACNGWHDEVNEDAALKRGRRGYRGKAAS